MTTLKPLVFDSGRGVSRQLDPADVLLVPSDLQLGGKLGFYGTAPAAQQAVTGDWGQSLIDLFAVLIHLGLVQDGRTPTWQNGINSVALMGAVGPYEPGRLIIGSQAGWMPLDQPALVPGVIQVPASHAGAPETSPVSGLPMRTLAYSPILSYGKSAPPTTALAGALWFSTTSNELQVFDGTTWQPASSAALRALTTVLAAASKGALLTGDGLGGISTIPAPIGRGGRVLAFDASQQGHYIDLVTVDTQPPWPANASSTDPIPAGGGRPAGVSQAIWCNPATGAESIAFWDETSLQWKKTYVDNPVLNQLGELRSVIAPGDLFTVVGHSVTRLPAGKEGENLVIDGGLPKWHDRFSSSHTAPSGALDGDLWFDDTTSTVRVRENGQWLNFNEVERFADINATGGAIKAGQPLVHGGHNWQLASQTTPPGTFIAIALTDAPPGGRVAGAVGGIVRLSEAQWSAVVDAAEARAIGAGLSAGRDYYLSSVSSGQLTTKPVNGIGIAVGTALSSTSLLLRNSPLRSADIATRAHISATPPTGRPGELWWSTEKGDLFIYFDDGTSAQWVCASADPATVGAAGGGAGGTTPGTPAPGVVSLEAIDWAADPLAAAIRVHYDDGTDSSLRIRGAGGTVVTMADNQTLVIDAGGGRIPSNALGGGVAFPPGATDGQVLVWRGGVPVWETVAAGGGGAAGNALLPGNGVQADPISHEITGIDEGSF